MKKRILSLLLAVMMILTLMPTAALADTTASGTCGADGDNLTWTLVDGVLTISGTGAMTDYIWSRWDGGDFVTTAPWRDSCKNITSVVINSGAISIGNSAFSGCSSLTSVTIPNSVTTINGYAFSGCSSLVSVEIPNSVTTIGYDAFSGCSSLTSVTIPDSVTTIGDSAFSGCSSLVSVEIPNSVTTIGESAFSSCSGLTSVTIPNSVTTIGSGTFRGCSSLTNVTIPNKVTKIDDEAFEYCSALVEMAIPDGVVVISYSAFYGCSGLTSVTIPNSVTMIGSGAFYGCSSLTSVTIPNSVTTIGSSTFNGCSGMESVTIPNSVTTIGESAFSSCSGLTSVTIPDSVTTIGNSAFNDCYRLTSVTIPNSVTTIGNYAFNNCSDLTSVTIPDSVTTIGNYAFYGCSSLTDVYYGGTQEQWNSIIVNKSSNEPLFNATIHYNDDSHTHSYVGGVCTVCGAIDPDYKYAASGICGENLTWTLVDGVLTISGTGAMCSYYLKENSSGDFVNAAPWGDSCKSITLVVIDSGVTFISDYAFYECSGLTSVAIPNSMTQIGSWAFGYCSGLTSVAIPNSVTTIADCAFYECSGLTSVTIPEGVTTIGINAFQGCSGLTSMTIPNSVTTIADCAFSRCSGLTSVTIPDSVTTISDAVFYGCSGLTSVTIADNVTEIGGNAFDGCSSLTSVTIPNSVTTISGCTFRDCSSLTSMTIPNSVTTIGIAAFSRCSSLTSVTIPDSVTEIGDYTFYGCSSLTDVYYGGTQEQWNSIIVNKSSNEPLFNATIHYNDGSHTHSYTKTVTAPTCEEQGYTTYTCSCGDSYVDNYVDAKGHYYNSITHICSVCGETDPAYREHEHNYENGICRDCFAIDPDYKHATSGYCGGEGDGTNLKWKLKDNVLTISGKGAMRDYENNYFESLIPWYAQRMTIEQLVIEKGVTTIGYDSFSEFYGMTSVVIPDGVTVIGGCAFWCCTNLADVTIPDSVQTIGQRAFINCSSLTSIDIPANVTTIEQSAFWGCYNLTDVYYDGTREQWNAISIDYDNECLTNATIHFKEDTCEHSYTEKVVDPTCTERGYTLHTCSLCGYSYKDTYVAAKGHKTETRNVIEATCSQAGYTGDKYCTVCQKFVERGEETPLANHKYILGTCIVCGQSQSGSGLGSLFPSLHTHDYTDEVIAPTCTDMGYTRHTCKDCGFSYKNQYKFSTGHTTELQNAKAATCTEVGYSGDKYCTVCKQTIEKGTEIKALGHTIELQNVKAATCTTAGYSGDKYCTVCKQTIEKGTEIKALGHNYVNGACSVCGATNAMYNPFKDVDKDTHKDYYDAILWAYYNDITKGTNAAGDMFSPELGCTRAQIVTFLWRQSGAPVVEVANPFVDVDREKHADYYNAILWGYSTGVVKGVSDTEFAPDKICSRAEIVTMLYRLDGENAVTTGTQFTDLTQDWYKDAIAWAVAEKITKGTSDTTFTPDAPCTRAQTVTFLYRYFA